MHKILKKIKAKYRQCAERVKCFVGEMRKKHRKGMAAGRRIWTGVERILIIGVFLIFSALLSYYVIACAVSFIEDNKLPPILECWKVFGWYITEAKERTGYVPAITVASASLMLSLITLMQSHFNRAQDRVMSFPPNYLDEVMIGLDVKSNLKWARKFFNPVESQNLIKLNYKSGFSTYYRFYPYRLFVCLSKENMGNGIEWEEVKLYNYQYSTVEDDNPNSYEVLIEGSESRLLKEYCNKSDKNESMKLKFILDSRWTNNLVPLWMRNFSDIYIREEFGLNYVKLTEGKNTEKRDPFNRYKVMFSEYRRAPLASWRLLGKCSESREKFAERYTKETENAKRLQERERK